MPRSVGIASRDEAASRRAFTSGFVLAGLVICSALLYGQRLAYAPPHLEIDEVLIAVDAHSIATTGRDLRGERLPLYSQTAEHSWYQPLVIYVTALALSVLPFSEWAVRVPTVCIAIVDIALMYLVARHLFGSRVLGAIAAGLLMLTPAHFIHTRYGMDYIYPVPFILAWLLCLVLYQERRRGWLLVVGAGILGVGFYSYISSIVMMPVYFMLTWLALFEQQAPRRAYGLAAAGFFPALLPFIVWLARHPSAYAATVEKYGLYDASRLDAVQALRSAFGFVSIAQRLSEYWNFFNPAFLFFGSGTKAMFSTGLAGVFLLPLAVFLVAGIVHVLTHRGTPINLVVLLGFVTAPLAALIVDEENAIFRALALLPFGVLLATMGVRSWWTGSIGATLRPVYRPLGVIALAAGAGYAAFTLLTGARLTRSPVPLVVLGLAALAIGRIGNCVTQGRIVAACLLALMPIQFGYFWRDYFSDYRVRSSYWLGGNIRGALEEMIDRDQRDRTPRVYFSTLRATSGQADGRNQYMDAYWKFYLIKHRRQDLLARTSSFVPDQVNAVPAGSLVLANVGDSATEALVGRGALRRVATIQELDRSNFFVILQR
jgi:4-amino-4-deoxy-L-arabinose transferase-like glycosyltransferase